MKRASFVKSAAALAGAGAIAPWKSIYGAVGGVDGMLPIEAEIDRITKVTVCTRPFRAAGPRLETEGVAGKVVVHNYGHGGSGWSLSWGSAALAIEKIVEAGESRGELAVIGCGAIGLTTALTAQRAGMRVTIYAKERPPFVRSNRATGSWTPDSRIALQSDVSRDFGAIWERMARRSFAMHQSFLGIAGTPVEWTDRFRFSDLTRDEAATRAAGLVDHGFVDFGDRIADITPDWHDLRLGDGRMPFGVKRARRSSSMTFNIADYARQLVNDFYGAGGALETREFHAPSELGALPQRTIANCTGYDSRTLWSDESITPVRGQIAWLIPQEGVNYGIALDGLNVLARRDGIVVQPTLQGDDTGWNDDNESPDRVAAEAGVRALQRFLARQPRP